MANEYLKRTPTSTGNRKVWTWSVWVKKNIPGNSHILLSASVGNGSAERCSINLNNSDQFEVVTVQSSSVTARFKTDKLFRDTGNWMHIVVSCNTTESNADDRFKLFINGVQYTQGFNTVTNPSQNANLNFNDSAHTHKIGNNHSTTYSNSEYTDYFWVDGQALTPEVFGYNKDGRGYISAGSTQATDFRNGQWLPKKPKLIIDEINASGGFGVNGFYLPMNSSNNFGADFHTTPNTILKLKDNLPQPKAEIDGSGDYSGDIRDDLGGLPFPGVVKFDGDDYLSISDTSGLLSLPGSFTIELFTYFSTITSQVTFVCKTEDNSQYAWFLQYISSSGGIRFYPATGSNTGTPITFDWTPSVGIWYHLALTRDASNNVRMFVDGVQIGSTSTNTDNLSSTGRITIGDNFDVLGTQELNGFISNLRIIKGTALYTSNFTPPTQPLQKTTDTVLLCCNSKTDPTNEETGKTITKNGDVYATTSELTDALVLAIPGVSGGLQNGFGDYSAAIRGSGIAKNVTASGDAGVSATSSYYGSALSFPNNGVITGDDYLTITDNGFAVGTGDFTVEAWINPDSLYNYQTIFATRPNNGPFTDGFNVWINANGATGVYSNAFLTQTANGAINPNQWTHVVAERYNGTLTTYVNGVAAAVQTSNTQDYTRILAGIGQLPSSSVEAFTGQMQDVRFYKGVAKYKGGFDVPKPYTPVGIATWRAVSDCTANNFATLNPLHKEVSVVLSNGNLSSIRSAGWGGITSTIGLNGGKYYWEILIDGSSSFNFMHAGITDNSQAFSNASGSGHESTIMYYTEDNTVKDNSSSTATGLTMGIGDILQLAFDGTTREFFVGVNGTFANSGNAIRTAPAGYNYVTLTQNATTPNTHNFGQNPTFSGQVTAGTYTDSNGKGLFKYEPPSGFLALCEDNLPTPTIKDPGEHFKTVLYTGDNSEGRSITGVGFKPDLIWFKARNVAVSHVLNDTVRGVTAHLSSNTTDAEIIPAYPYLNSVDSDGFSLRGGTSSGGNISGRDMVAWCWKAGEGNTVTNTDGSITSQVSANQDAGFSIVSWTGNNTSGSTLGHGLTKTPAMIIIKARTATTPAGNWIVLHKGNTPISSYSNSSTFTLSEYNNVTLLNSTLAQLNYSFDAQVNGASPNTYIAYCWAEIEGYSKFGSYVGNDSTDGPFVYCGFKPAFVLLKASSTTGNWCMTDNARNPTNPTYYFAVANAANAGDDTGGLIDFVSNGFKLRLQSPNFNGNGVTYIFAAFAESPFQYANSK